MGTATVRRGRLLASDAAAGLRRGPVKNRSPGDDALPRTDGDQRGRPPSETTEDALSILRPTFAIPMASPFSNGSVRVGVKLLAGIRTSGLESE